MLSFTTFGKYYGNVFPSEFPGQAQQQGFAGWGAFDGTTNDPVVFPVGSSIQALENWVLSGGVTGSN
jgi:hypothetical protein